MNRLSTQQSLQYKGPPQRRHRISPSGWFYESVKSCKQRVIKFCWRFAPALFSPDTSRSPFGGSGWNAFPNIPVWHPNRYSLCLSLLSQPWFQQASETGKYNVFLIIPASYTIIFPAYLLCLKQILINPLNWRNGFKLFSAWNWRMGQARI